MLRNLFLLGLVGLFLAACAGPGGRSKDSTGGKNSAGGSADGDQAVQSARPRAPIKEDVMYNVLAAEYLGSEGDLEGAVGLYLEAALESSDPEIARRATRIAYATQSWLQAAMAADRWAVLAPESVAAHESAAAALLITGDYAAAELQLNRIIELLDNSAEAWIKISTLLGQSGDSEKASATLQNVLAHHGDVGNANAMYARSQLAVRERDLDKAYQLAQKAVELDPANIDFLAWAARLALNMNLTSAGVAYIERAWKLEPENHDLALAYSDLLARTGRADSAREVMRSMPQTPDVMLSRVLFEISDQKPAAAEALLEEFSLMDFEDPMEKAFYQAQAAEALLKVPQAIAFYALVVSGEHALLAGLRRADLMAREGDLEGARRELAAMRIQTSEVFVEESWLAEARILRAAGDSEQALEILGLALEQLPKSVAILYSRALLAAELGWVDIAENDLRLIISEQPENAAALNALGYTLADQTERYEEAESLIRQAYILEPEEASIVDSMGWISFRLGRLAEAEEYLRKAWALDKNPEIGAHLGEVLWVRNMPDAARAVWNDAKKVDSENAVLKETIERLDPGQ